MAYKTIIIEDDVIAQKSIQTLLDKIKEIDLVTTFTDAQEGLAYLQKENVDLVFLDVEMPGMTGIELMDNLEYLPNIIMTTSNSEYAVDAFAYDVVDFLIKPITLPKLQTSLEKVKRARQSLADLATASRLNEIYLRVDGALVRVPVEDIFYFENVGDYVKVITEGKVHVLYGALKSIDQRLKHPRLLKVHRSFIVNLGKIKDIEDNTIVLTNKKVIPVSRAHKSILLNHLNIL